MTALIGTGVIGQSLQDHMTFSHVFGRHNIHTLAEYKFDQVIVAAPSGNRLAINKGNTSDCDDIDAIVCALRAARPQHVILIGSVDAVTAAHTEYGLNRLNLEIALQSVADVSVLRLCTLIGSRIQKNALYDIKHKQFLNEIDAGAWLQWCLLDHLPQLINHAQPGTVMDVVSEPIQTKEILARYIPDQQFNSRQVSPYYNQQPYCYTKQEIFAAMDQYML
jgi:hypothetical protein